MPELRKELLARTNWSKQTLSNRVKGLRKITPMHTNTAQAVLAHQQAVALHRFLDKDAVAEVQRVLPLLNGASTPAPTGKAQSEAKARPRERHAKARPFNYDDPILPPAKLHEAREMAEAYPLLYVLENSMRELVKRVMEEKYGKDWWNTELTTGRAKTVKNNADGRRTGESHRRWHQRRGAHPIDYTDLGDLGELIIAKRPDFFPDVFGGEDSQEWFEQFMRELVPSRHVVCHMNPLSETNLADLPVKLRRWREVVRRWAEDADR